MSYVAGFILAVASNVFLRHESSFYPGCVILLAIVSIKSPVCSSHRSGNLIQNIHCINITSIENPKSHIYLVESQKPKTRRRRRKLKRENDHKEIIIQSIHHTLIFRQHGGLKFMCSDPTQGQNSRQQNHGLGKQHPGKIAAPQKIGNHSPVSLCKHFRLFLYLKTLLSFDFM